MTNLPLPRRSLMELMQLYALLGPRWDWWITLLSAMTAAIYVLMTGINLWHLRWARRLPTSADPHASGSQIRCSVVIAARDEASRIERTVRQVLAQEGVQIEVIVVDDRSTDGTAELIQRLASDDSRVQLRRVEQLPAGWLGKCHACHIGAQAATGEWILFMDADCWLKSDVVARAFQVAAQSGADHVTLTPGVIPETLAAQAWHLVVLTSLAGWMSGVNRDRRRAYLGIGAFNLVRSEAYHQCGGYEALRMTVVDDVYLGFLLSRAGKRTRGFFGGDDACCNWGTTVPNMIKIMEKNYLRCCITTWDSR